jgi:CHASE2 domain-containing sensor protein
MNPLDKLPPVVRTTLYVIGTIGLLVYSAVIAANGDWVAAIPIFFGSLITGTALTHRPTK